MRLGAALAFVVLAAGCVDPSDPTDGATAFTGSDAPVVAAMVWSSSGGIAGWSSGPSAVLYLADGAVIYVEGTPWGPADDTVTPCTMHAGPLQRLAALGGNFTIDCPAQDVAAIHSAVLAASERRGHADLFEGLRLDVPASQQQAKCCDRVFTHIHLFVNGHVDVVVTEGQGTDPGPSNDDTDHGRFIHAMDGLAVWVRDP